jgi:hypothetical protein
LTKLFRWLPTLLILALSALYPVVPWTQVEAQNVEGQIVASQFGEYQVPTVGNGFSFPPDTCEISGGNKSFPAFTSGVPIKIVDTNPAYSEVDTPVAVIANDNVCAVSMTTNHPHTSFYLTSGTGGLQEALNANGTGTGANTILLNAQWYSLIAPNSGSSVIGSVQGNTNLGLVDVTTTPYTTYAWNGSTYAAAGYGAPGGPAMGALSGTYPAPGLANGTSGLNNVLPLAAGTTINDGSVHTVGTAPIGSPFHGVTTLGALAALSINGTSPFSWITGSPFSNGGIYVIGVTNPGSGGTAGTFALSFSGGGCNTEPTGTFTVGASTLAQGAGTITSVSLTTRGSGCTSTPTISTSASSGLSGASVVATYIGNSTVGSLDIAWLAIQAALETGKAYIPAGQYVIGSTLATPLYILPAAINTGVLAGTPSMLKGDGIYSTQLLAGSDFGAGLPLIAAGDPAGTAANTLGRYATNGTQDFEGEMEDLSIQSSASNIYFTPGTTPIQMDGFAWGAHLRTKDIDVLGFNHDWSIVGDHTEFTRPHADGGAVGFEWPAPNATIYGDLAFVDLNASGQSIASLSVSPTATIFGTFNGETYLSAPYAILGEAGPGCAAIFYGTVFDHLMTEYIGNAFFADDNNFSAGTYNDANKCRQIGPADIGIWYSSYNNSHFWGSGRARRASIDVWSAALNIHDLTPAGGNFSPNVAAPSGGAPIATFNLTSVLQNGIYGIRVAGDVNLWLSSSDSGSVPTFTNSVATASNAGIILEQTGLWSGAVRGWTAAGNYTTTTAGDVFEAYGNGVAPGGSGLAPVTSTAGIAMQSGVTTSGAIPLAQEGVAAVGVGYANPGYQTWEQSTGIGTPITITAAGSGGTNGTFTGISGAGGGCSTEPVFTFTVSGGAITATTITSPGVGCTSAPTLPTTASAGLTGATLTATWPSALAAQSASLSDPNIIGQFVGGSGSGAHNFVLAQLHLGSGGGLGPSTNLNVASLATAGNVTAGGSINANGYLINWGGNVSAYSPQGGVLRLTNAAVTNFTRLILGPATTGFPAFCVNASSLSICDGTGGTAVTGLTATINSEESVAFSTTPSFSTAVRESTITLTAAITSFTLAAGAPGQEKTLTFCQNGTGGYTVAAPSNVRGFMTVGTTASKCSSQHFTYNSIQAAWIADSPGVVNE